MNNEKKGIKSDFNMVTIMVIPVAIAVNFIVGNLVLALKLPVYLDMIGTFLVSILAGPWVGGLTGALSIAINAVTDPSLFPFAILSGILGVVAGSLARKGLFNNLKKFILSAIIVTLMAVILNVVLTYVFFGGFGSSGVSMVIGGMISAGVPFWPAQIIGRFLSEVPDKFISLLVPYLVVKGMSDRYLYKFSNGLVFIEARKEQKGRK